MEENNLSKLPDVAAMIRELKPNPVIMPLDLDNQILSDDPFERERQLAWRAQKKEEGVGG